MSGWYSMANWAQGPWLRTLSENARRTLNENAKTNVNENTKRSVNENAKSNGHENAKIRMLANEQNEIE